MTQLKLGSITLIVNGYTLNNGIPYFQKSVPASLRNRFGKATIKLRLWEKDGNFAVQCHRHNEKFSSLFAAMKQDPRLTPSETKIAAIALLSVHGLKQGDALSPVPRPAGLVGNWDGLAHLDVFGDVVEEQFGQPTPVTDAAFLALRNQLPVLLSEAFTVYLDNHQKGKDKGFQADQRQHWNKLVALVGDIALEGLSREHAKQYRDHRLNHVKTASVKREIGVLKAVVNVACRELSLAMKNPFDSLTIQGVNQDSVKRLSFTEPELKLLLGLAEQADDEPRRILLVLALTGARLAEVVGLRKQDFNQEEKTIFIRPHVSRSLKTPASQRVVPLLPLALSALEKQLQGSKTEFLFPRYANTAKTNADSASATLNKWLRASVTDLTVHSLRHTMRDRLRAVMCPEAIAKEVGGWTAGDDASTSYGQGYPLDIKRTFLEKAYEIFSGKFA